MPHHKFVLEYRRASHSWHTVNADDVKTCEKFPFDDFTGESTPREEEV